MCGKFAKARAAQSAALAAVAAAIEISIYAGDIFEQGVLR
jgi:hypothetical protein